MDQLIFESCNQFDGSTSRHATPSQPSPQPLSTSCSSSSSNPSSSHSSTVTSVSEGSQLHPFSVGDRIKLIAIAIDQLESLKKNHKRPGILPAQYLNKSGFVSGISENQELIVKLDDSQIVWSFNNNRIRCERFDFVVDDLVKVIDDLDELKKLQRGHGEYVPEMRKFLGSKGIVVKVFTDGDLKVTFDGGSWTLNSDCLINLSELERRKQTGATHSTVGSGGYNNQNAASNESPDLSANNSDDELPFTIGDAVKVISVSPEVLEAIQKAISWNPRMAKYMNKTGIVQGIADKKVKVRFDNSEVDWTFSPEALVKHSIGDIVKVTDDKDLLRGAFLKHKPSELMAIAGATGVVVDADNDGDFIVNTRGGTWTLKPSCVINLSEIERSKQPKETLPPGIYTWKEWTDELSSVDERSVTLPPSVTNRNFCWTKSDEDSNLIHLHEKIQSLESKILKIEEANACGVCFENQRNTIFPCGHGACRRCATMLADCHLCRNFISQKINLY